MKMPYAHDTDDGMKLQVSKTYSFQKPTSTVPQKR